MTLPSMNATQKAAAETVRDALAAAETSAKATKQSISDAVAQLKITLGLETDLNNQATSLEAFGAEAIAISLRGQADKLLGDIMQGHYAMSKALAATFSDAGTVIQGGGGGRRSI